MKNVLKLSFACVLTTLLSACGGGGGGGGTSATLNGLTTLNTFSDGHGILRVRDDDSNVVAMVPNIGTISGTVPATTTETVSVTALGVDTNGWGRYYSMTATVNGVAVSTAAWLDSTSNALMLYSHFQSNPALVAAGGPALSNIPSGSYVYRGVNVFGTRASGGGWASDAGTFTMSVNFDTGITDIVASTPSNGGSPTSSLVHTNIPINLTAGTFQSSTATLSIGGATQSASVYGSFHGSGATGVSGIYHDNNSTPVYAGSFAGHR